MKIAHGWPRFKSVPYQIWLGLFLATSVVAILALRHNNQQMIKLRNEVYAADKVGEDVNLPLNKLRAYVYGHMNTDLTSGGNSIKPPIQLKYTYERLQLAADQAANNNQLYTEAENYCQALIPASQSISGGGRVGCVSDYVLSHGGKNAAQVPAALYEFDFASPSWSPDLAGWAIVFSLLFLVLSAASLLVRFI